MKLEINQTSLNVELYGPDEGPSVVLLHHGLGAIPAWRRAIPVLEDAGYRVLVYDRRGYGASAECGQLAMPEFAVDQQDLAALLDYYEIEQAALVGHSDGGTIALYFAARQPERVLCACVVAAHIYVEPKMETGIYGVRRAYESDVDFSAGLQRLHGDKVDRVFSGWYDGWVRQDLLGWDMRPDLARITCPVLVVQGLEDEHASPEHAQNLAASIPRSELWLVEGAGHMLPQENALVFNSRLVAFLRSAYV